MHQHKKKQKAALDIRAALATLNTDHDRVHRDDQNLTADEAAADFASSHASIPAKAGSISEPAVVYPQQNKPALLIGTYGCEKRVRNWLEGLPDKVSPQTLNTLKPVTPVITKTDERVYWEKADLGKLPIPQVTARDAGPYITMGFIVAKDGDKIGSVSAHRMLVSGPDKLGVWMLSSRHLRALAQAAWDKGQVLPVSINIGVPPAVAIASATGTANLPKAFDKLSLAGGLACDPIALTQSAKSDVAFLSNSEFVLEGFLTPASITEALDGNPVAGSMPEFLGFDGDGQTELACLEVKHISQRKGAAFQATVGPGREQSVILGLGGALSLALGLSDTRYATVITNLRFSHAGGGMLLLYVALQSGQNADMFELSRNLINLCPFIKTIVYVDDDVDLNCDEDVMWAMTTRAQLADDCHALEGYSPMGMDPSQSEKWASAKDTQTYKSFVDATIPSGLEKPSRRAFS